MSHRQDASPSKQLEEMNSGWRKIADCRQRNDPLNSTPLPSSLFPLDPPGFAWHLMNPLSLFASHRDGIPLKERWPMAVSNCAYDAWIIRKWSSHSLTLPKLYSNWLLAVSYKWNCSESVCFVWSHNSI